jgi:hypothetical protein
LRELRPELSALINSLHCNWHSTMDITLQGNEQLFLSTGEIFVDRFGKTQQYLSKVKSVGELGLSLDVEADTCEIVLSNVDLLLGQTLSSDNRKLDGAESVLGVLFIDKDQPLDEAIWDAKVPMSIVQGDTGDEEIKTSLISVVDSIIVSGRTIAEEFQWREPLSNAPLIDPNDIGPRPGGSPIDPNDDPRRGGRYRDFNPIDPSLY